MRYFTSAFVLTAVGLFFLQPSAANAQANGDKATIFKSISPERLESLLKGMNINFKKTASKKTAGTFFYDYTNRDNFKLRLGLHDNGKILWVDGLFGAISLDAINNWNRRAKFGRAVSEKQQKTGKTISIIEWQLDLVGGCSEAIIRQYLRQFDIEVQRFSKHVSDSNKSL